MTWRVLSCRYAVNGATTVALFAVVGLELKHRAPKAHTMLEVIYVRWGRAAHIVFFFFAVLTNLLVSLSMLQGGWRAFHHESPAHHNQ